MPIKGIILIVIIAVVIGVIERDRISEWLREQSEDDDIDNNNQFKED
jgi:Mg2+/citrate symporter